MINKYAKIENNVVSNVIICDDSQIGLLDGTHIKVDDHVHEGYTYSPSKNKFASTQPFSSWTFDEEEFEWNAPKPKPEGNWFWSEIDLDWIQIVPNTFEE
jgi:hypothetical protein